MVKTTTKKKILESTLKLISEKGYLGTTTKDIAYESGITEVTLFRHFGTKERLFEEVLKCYTFLPKLKEVISEIEGDSINYGDTLKKISLRFFETLKERKSFVRILSSEMNVYPEKTREVFSKFIDETNKVLAGYFKSQQNVGILRRFDTEIGARGFLGMLFCYFNVEEIVMGKSISRKKMEKVIQEFVEIFVNGTLKV
ncbi:MAG: TetR/AcrR family transcriptional regulator [Nitrospirae bacterium]|nr:TetR/AcrR family transcriptional regulator [Nitrospirota bacterium]